MSSLKLMGEAASENRVLQDDCFKVLNSPRCQIRESSFIKITREMSSCKTQLLAAQCDEFLAEHPEFKDHRNSCNAREICARYSYASLADGCREVAIEFTTPLNDGCSNGATRGFCIAGNAVGQSFSSFASLLPYVKGPLLGGRSIPLDLYRGAKKANDYHRHFACLDTAMRAKIACYIAVGAGSAIITKGVSSARFALLAREIEGLNVVAAASEIKPLALSSFQPTRKTLAQEN